MKAYRFTVMVIANVRDLAMRDQSDALIRDVLQLTCKSQHVVDNVQNAIHDLYGDDKVHKDVLVLSIDDICENFSMHKNRIMDILSKHFNKPTFFDWDEFTDFDEAEWADRFLGRGQVMKEGLWFRENKQESFNYLGSLFTENKL